MLLRCEPFGLCIDVTYVHWSSRNCWSPETAGTVRKMVRKYLTYNAGTDVATPLDDIIEILSYAADLIPMTAGGAVQGVFIHRGTAIPLVCLPTLVGRGQPADRKTST